MAKHVGFVEEIFMDHCVLIGPCFSPMWPVISKKIRMLTLNPLIFTETMCVYSFLSTSAMKTDTFSCWAVALFVPLYMQHDRSENSGFLTPEI